jgi:Gas vesicle synthesis protein GvpL/GvpF
MSEDTGVWAYAITEHSNLSGPDGEVDLSWLTGVGETKVRTATSCGLTVLVSDVSLAEYGEAALRENLENLDWLDEVAREHHYVVDAAARLFPLLPVRLAVVYSGDDAVCAALTTRNSELRDALRRVGGRVEWGVKVYAAAADDDAAGETGGDAERAPAAARAGDDAADAERRPAAVSAGDGDDRTPKTEGGAEMAHLRRRRAHLTSARESRSAAVSGAQAVHAELTAKAIGTRLHPPQSARLSGVRQPMLLNAAYLLDPADSVTFTATVAGQASAHPELRLELTGPWPPYSFAGQDDDGQT